MENEDLEEGEIAEDSSDDDVDVKDETPLPTTTTQPSTSAQDPGPQKKRKKVIRKVRRKIKIKKKIPKKKEAPFVSLWEQQISMLEELQRAQLLRAAATDEDLRIFPNSILAPTFLSSVPVSAAPPVPISAPVSAPLTVPTAAAPVPTFAPLAASAPQSNTAPLLDAHQTPSSPDDENGKPSYEAISKMLTLLRNSVNDPDSSDIQNTDSTNNIASLDNVATIADTKPSITETPNLLIPILVEGIDYTKYKLLSRYEPKLKNDPRLCQQS